MRKIEVTDDKEMNRLAEELDTVSPFDIGAEAVANEPGWFIHPNYKDLYFKIGMDTEHRIMGIWITLDSNKDKAVFLTIREATDKEKDYFRKLTGRKYDA